MNTKGSLRTHFLGLLKKQEAKQRLSKSQDIADKLYRLPAFQKAHAVMFYMALPGEVETLAMIQKAIQLHKKVTLPVIQSNQRNMIPTLTTSLEELRKGPYGVLEPAGDSSKQMDINELDAVIVPGLAFDHSNNRLGRGAGYYDRFLCRLPQDCAKIGIAFDFQVIESLPTDKHDVALDLVIAA